ncbi:MAG: phosphoglycerate kinase [Parcubacteria group bacterium]|jgi:phosphoglycerate kinase
MKKIQEAKISGKRILVRVDFNVGIENGKVKESFKIAAAKETVDYLLARGAKVALLTHLGRPEGKVNLEFSLQQLASDAELILCEKITFVADCVGEKVKEALDNLQDGIVLLENVRFYAGDEANDADFAQQLAENFDVFVNDAFSASHRDHASVTGVAKILPSYAGLRLQEEIHEMTIIKDHPVHPAVAIIGGAKIETKVPLINNFEKTYDAVLVGSKIAMEAKEEGLVFSDKVILPIDYAEGGLDIGQETIEQFKNIIAGAKTIVWNGPVGKFEEKPYDAGTMAVLDAIVASGAFSVVGGGESVEVLEENNLLDEISFVSTGGGAMLEYLGGKILPGLEVLS